MPKQITDDQLERIGALVEGAANFHAASKLPMPHETHAKHLAGGMANIRDELRSLYHDIAGDDPWEGHPGWESKITHIDVVR